MKETFLKFKKQTNKQFSKLFLEPTNHNNDASVWEYDSLIELIVVEV